MPMLQSADQREHKSTVSALLDEGKICRLYKWLVHLLL